MVIALQSIMKLPWLFCLVYFFFGLSVYAEDITPSSHVVFFERAQTVPRHSLSFSVLSKFSREVISVSREEVAFSDYGYLLRTGYGITKNLELRNDVQWITFSQSGHSGQFDFRIGPKLVLNRKSFSKVETATSAFLSVGGFKIMGHTPWYFVDSKLPLTLTVLPFELSVSPRLIQGFESQSPLTFSIESVVTIKIHNTFSVFAEWFMNEENPNPRFTAFLFEKGVGYWAGVRLQPTQILSLSISMLSKALGRGIAYGVTGVSAQVRLN